MLVSIKGTSGGAFLLLFLGNLSILWGALGFLGGSGTFSGAPGSFVDVLVRIIS